MMTSQQGGAETRSSSGDYVQSLARGLAVIRAFSDEDPRHTVSTIAQRCSLSRPAARRFLLTLTELGYISTDGTQYWLTPQVLELGRSYLSSLSLSDLAQPHLTKLSASLNESSSLTILDGFDIIYVARVQVRRIMSITIVVGTRYAASATAMGRVLLAGLPASSRKERLAAMPLTTYTSGSVVSPEDLAAELDRVKAQGFCVTDHSVDYGLYSAAAPVRDSKRNTIAAVSVSVPVTTFSKSQFANELLPLVISTADQISVDVRHTGTLAWYT